jgi:hypothetical protein
LLISSIMLNDYNAFEYNYLKLFEANSEIDIKSDIFDPMKVALEDYRRIVILIDEIGELARQLFCNVKFIDDFTSYKNEFEQKEPYIQELSYQLKMKFCLCIIFGTKSFPFFKIQILLN